MKIYEKRLGRGLISGRRFFVLLTLIGRNSDSGSSGRAHAYGDDGRGVR